MFLALVQYFLLPLLKTQLNLARRYLSKTFAELANIHTALSHPRALVIYMKVCGVCLFHHIGI